MAEQHHEDGPWRLGERLALVPGLATAIGIEREVHEQRLVGTLRTGLPRADVAVDADPTENAFVINVVGSGIAKFLRIL